jgi:HK97 family phage prohead protease
MIRAASKSFPVGGTDVAAKAAGAVLELPAAGQLTVAGGAGEWSGYAWRWGTVDRQNETVARGAFAASVARINAGSPVPLRTDHDFSDAFAGVVGAVTRAREDEAGLHLEGTFTDDEAGQTLRAKAMSGAVIGLSIGGPILDARPGPGGTRELVAVDLAHVVVTGTPAHPGAMITAAKQDDLGCITASVVDELAQLETWARGEQQSELLTSFVEDPSSMLATAQFLVDLELRDQQAELEAWAATVRLPSEAEKRREAAQVRRETDNRHSYGLHAVMRASAPAGGCGRCGRCRSGSECIYG